MSISHVVDWRVDLPLHVVPGGVSELVVDGDDGGRNDMHLPTAAKTDVGLSADTSAPRGRRVARRARSTQRLRHLVLYAHPALVVVSRQ